MRRVAIVALLFLVPVVAYAQIVGTCPPSSVRASVDVRHLRGLLVDPNLAVIPAARITLQKSSGNDFRDLKFIETDQLGRFDFGRIEHGSYRLKFEPLQGLCRALVAVRVSGKGWRGIRMTVPVAATDTCPAYCDDRVKIEEIE